jgi:DnaJ-class molecular chaperone
MRVSNTLVQCAACKGSGILDGESCCGCDGKGKVRVATPPRTCPRCNGTGLNPDRGTLYGTTLCPVCSGCGWALLL